jgi:hypothetical protein
MLEKLPRFIKLGGGDCLPLFKGAASKSKPAKVIAYVTDPKKAVIVSSQSLDDNSDYAKQFSQTASLFGKGNNFSERKYYHFKLSPNPADNASAEQVHRMAVEMSAKCFSAHECVIATHADKNHVHTHIIVNAVSFEDGRKLRITNPDYAAMKDLVNEVGLSYGFTPLDFRKPSKDKIRSREKQLLLRGGTGWKDELKDVISAAKEASFSFNEFAQHLKNYGIAIERNTEKTISFKHPKKQKPIRGERLGADFTKEAIVSAINEHSNRAAAFSEKPTVYPERTVTSDFGAVADGAGKHHAQADLDRISRTIQGIERTAERFSPASGRTLLSGQKDASNDAERDDSIQQITQQQHRNRMHEAER